MGFFTNFFSGSKQNNDQPQMEWKQISEINQLNKIVQLSKEKTIAIFKHSTRCAISRSVLNRFSQVAINNKDTVDFYYLDLLKYREISNEIMHRFGIIHQSPQLIILKDENVIGHASHHEILGITWEKMI